ncbi:MAG: hypothetical protein II193_10150 [Lachnospiraceae bacterium]|nr:hypothetical protein [Lachnospiraceae bacterium]
MIKESYDKIISLEEQSKKIFGIIETINDISSETELLSLNESIEVAAELQKQLEAIRLVSQKINDLAKVTMN